MVIFYDFNGNLYRRLCAEENFVWIINYQTPRAPRKISMAAEGALRRIPIPDSFLDESDVSKKREAKMRQRLSMLAPLMKNEEYIKNKKLRQNIAEKISKENHVTAKTVLGLYWKYLARGERGLLPEPKTIERAATEEQRNMARALGQYFYSPRKMSLRSTYEMMLLDNYRSADGTLMEERPSFQKFRYYYQCNKDFSRHVISREGIWEYQKNYRALLGKGDSGIDFIGAYEMDATQADIYIVSRYNRKPIGRPIVYLAIDIATRLIAGVYVGLEGTSDSVLACLSNAAMDKVEYCRKFGVEITPEMWPSRGLPSAIYTDRGQDFISYRIKELCKTFGMEISSLPAYRPDLKGYVEKAFDCLQSRYKPFLRGKGVTEDRLTGQGMQEYWREATIDLYEYTQILIECVLYYNDAHIQQNIIRTPELATSGTAPIASKLWEWHIKNGSTRIIEVNEKSLQLMLLPRETGYVTRKGVEFKGLHYYADDRIADFVQAGARGRAKVEIAYNPSDTNEIYIVENGVYHPLTLTLASQQMEGLCYEEVRLLFEEEAAVRKQLEPEQTEKAVKCAGSIRTIVEKAGTAQKHDMKDTQGPEIKRQRSREIRRDKEMKKGE